MKERWVTAEEGVKLYEDAGLSSNTFYRHAREKRIRKSLPDKRERGALYNLGDIEKLTYYPKLKSKNRIEAIQKIGEEESKTDWFAEADLPYLLALDYEMYGIEESLDLSISHGWWSKNPQICRILYNSKNRKEIWGYVTMIPMEQTTILKLLKREIHERDIRPEHILAYKEGNKYEIYAASIVIRPEKINHLRSLINSIFRYWCEQYPKVMMTKIYAYADSKEGWNTIKHLFFSPRYDIGEKAYELDLRQPNPSKMITAFQKCTSEKQTL